jgi:uncharacterized membrane protein YphA (DoxX/SURF4 family)
LVAQSGGQAAPLRFDAQEEDFERKEQEKIGFPYPDFTAHFVGSCEVICGLVLTLGLVTRLAGVPLLIIILTAIATTKILELFRPEQGLWIMVSDARTDFAIFMGITFLLVAGAGSWSMDVVISKRRTSGSCGLGSSESERISLRDIG